MFFLLLIYCILNVAFTQVWSSYNNLTLEEVVPQLNKLQSNLQETKASITDAQTMVNNLNYLYREFKKVHIVPHNYIRCICISEFEVHYVYP